MKKSFFVFFSFLSAFGTYAQESPNQKALRQLASEQRHLHMLRQERISTAVVEGLPRTIALTSEKMAVLVDYVDGTPYYAASHNLQARATTGVENVQKTFPDIPLSGGGMEVGVWDAGLVRATHIEFGGRVFNRYGSQINNHATHVAGTVGASGLNERAKGMLPDVKIIAYYGFDNDLAQMADEAANGLVLSNHSYGLLLGWEFENGAWQWFGGSNSVDSRFGFYSSKSRSIDQIAYNAPYYTMVWSAGNDRSDVGNGDRPPDGPFDCIGPSAAAKNVITVGAITGFVNYNGPSSAVMSTFSSWGPTNDGRIKPDLVADGVGVVSTSSSGDDAYTTLQGTSMAAPNVTGSLGLLQQYFRQSADTFMTSAGLKALAIHTAREAGNSPGPDYRFGWGVLNVEDAFHVLRNRNQRDTLYSEHVLSNGAVQSYYLLSDGRKPIVATLAWTDVAGTPPSDQNSTQSVLVNDLDIILVGPTGNYFRPWILDRESPNANATRGDNTLDNVEKIELAAPDPGLYTLRVSHKGNLVNGEQSYGLVFTGSSVSLGEEPIYWAAGNGSTSDGNWSETPGGDPDPTIQATGRTWVFRDNSMLDDDDVITLGENATIENFIWTSPRNVSIDLNGDTLFVEREFIVANNNLRIKNGVVILNSIGAPTLKLPFDGKDGCRVVLKNMAATEILGTVSLHSLVVQGPVKVNLQSLSFRELILDTGSDVAISGSHISIEESLSNRTESLSLGGNTWIFDGATLTASVPFESDDAANFQGSVRIEGRHSFASLRLGDELKWNDRLETNELLVGAGSSTIGHEEARIVVKESIEIQTLPDLETRLAGTSGVNRAVLQIEPRQILCLDHLLLENFIVETDGVFNAGINSTLINTEGILAIDCDDIIFPDFVLETSCANSVIKLSNTSTGAIDEYEWRFGDAISHNEDAFLKEQVVIFDAPGTYTITLIVRNEVAEVSYEKEVVITANPIGAIEILSREQGLIASINAPSFIWYLDGDEIPEATGRVWAPRESGVYRVAYMPSSASACPNRVSGPFEYELIMSVEDPIFAGKGLEVYPNPVSDVISIDNTSPGDRVVLMDITGRNVLSLVVGDDSSLESMDVSFLRPGIYFMKILRGRSSFSVKLIKK